MRRFLLVLIFASGLAPLAQGQTLGQVLRAVQKRQQLLKQRWDVESALEQEASPGYSPGSNPIASIQWEGGLPEMPADGQVEGLSVEAKIRLLKQAAGEVERLRWFFADPRCVANGGGSLKPLDFIETRSLITVETYSLHLRTLAAQLSQLNTVAWANLFNFVVHGSGRIEMSVLPVPPISPTGGIDSPYKTVSSNASIFVNAEGGAMYRSVGGVEVRYYVFDSGYSDFSFKGVAPGFKGCIRLFTSLNYDVNRVRGLTWPGASEGSALADTLYCPGNRLCVMSQLEAGESKDISGPGIDLSTTLLYGSWREYDLAPSDDRAGGSEFFVPDYQFANHDSEDLWESIYDPIAANQWIDDVEYPFYYGDGGWRVFPYIWAGWRSDWRGSWLDEGWYDDLGVYGPRIDGDVGVAGCNLNFLSVFVAKFEDEFSPAPAPPQAASELQIAADLSNHRLKIPLAIGENNECELVWQFPQRVQTSTQSLRFEGAGKIGFGGLAARHVLCVRGCGDWDAVYSGKRTDREPELEWVGKASDPNGRWATFGDYLSEWWAPVLTQVVCATYGVNVVQPPDPERYKYTIEFYRRDQVGAKDLETGRYSFSGDPVDKIEVENPGHNDAVAGKVRITLHKGKVNQATYDIDLDQVFVDDSQVVSSTWNLVSPFLKQTVVITPGSGSGPTMTPYKVVENTTQDGVTLPQVTRTYYDTWANPQKIQRIIEGESSPRTTTYNYQWTTDPNNLQIDHLTSIVQTQGLNPYTAEYNEAELLWHYVQGQWDISYTYSGNDVTETKKLNGTVVRTATTSYSQDMSKAATEGE